MTRKMDFRFARARGRRFAGAAPVTISIYSDTTGNARTGTCVTVNGAGQLQEVSARVRGLFVRCPSAGVVLAASLAAACSSSSSPQAPHTPSPQASTSPAVSTSSTARPTSALPDVTLVYAGGGAAVVGVSPSCCGTQGEHPSRLYLSTDLRHWRDVTPAGSGHGRVHGDHPMFATASFLDTQTGWVTTFEPGAARVRIFQTVNGGQSWTSLPGGSHSANAGATTRVQLLNPTVAYREVLEPTGPAMSLSLTTDAAHHWQPVYGGPPPRRQGQSLRGPFDMPMVFANRLVGFAADGVPPTVLFRPWPGYLWLTRDGGQHWARHQPPPSSLQHSCRRLNSSSHRFCLVGLPTITGTGSAVTTYLIRRRTSATVAFDTLDSQSQTWRTAAVRRLTLPPPIGQSRAALPLLSLPTRTIWWAASATPNGFNVQRTTDAGRTWHAAASHPPGRLSALTAVSGERALLTVTTGPAHGQRKLLVTTDGGGHWRTLAFPTG